MKRILFCLSFFIFNFWGVASYSQATSTEKELVLCVPSVNQKSFDEIKNKLQSIPGANLLAYCEQTKIFLITYNSKQIETEEEIVKQVEVLNVRYKTEIKTGTSISKLIEGCSKYTALPATDVAK